jgi:hypothetical protein
LTLDTRTRLLEVLVALEQRQEAAPVESAHQQEGLAPEQDAVSEA